MSDNLYNILKVISIKVVNLLSEKVQKKDISASTEFG